MGNKKSITPFKFVLNLFLMQVVLMLIFGGIYYIIGFVFGMPGETSGIFYKEYFLALVLTVVSLYLALDIMTNQYSIAIDSFGKIIKIYAVVIISMFLMNLMYLALGNRINSTYFHTLFIADILSTIIPIISLVIFLKYKLIK